MCKIGCPSRKRHDDWPKASLLGRELRRQFYTTSERSCHESSQRSTKISGACRRRFAQKLLVRVAAPLKRLVGKPRKSTLKQPVAFRGKNKRTQSLEAICQANRDRQIVVSLGSAKEPLDHTNGSYRPGCSHFLVE